jgi:hypothetical protein
MGSSVEGEGGDDTLDGDDDSPGDALDCGAGLDDSAVVDLGDTVLTTCETQTQNYRSPRRGRWTAPGALLSRPWPTSPRRRA